MLKIYTNFAVEKIDSIVFIFSTFLCYFFNFLKGYVVTLSLLILIAM
jgi:hypothetical protein